MSSSKFGRNYRLTLAPGDGLPPIIVTMPFTIEFSIVKDSAASLNHITLDVYNLSAENRRRIFVDMNAIGVQVDANGDPVFDQYGYIKGNLTVILEAGYDTLYQVFRGHGMFAGSARAGVDIITHVEAQSGIIDVPVTQTFQTLQAGQTLGDIFNFLIGEMPILDVGAIGNYDTVLNRSVVLNGNTWDLLKKYSAGQVYIDDDKIYVLQKNEVLSADQIPLFNAATGMLDTPRREGGQLIVTTLLETGVQINQQVKLESLIQQQYNGVWKVIGIQHDGIISGAQGGDCRSTFRLLAPGIFKNIVEVDPQ